MTKFLISIFFGMLCFSIVGLADGPPIDTLGNIHKKFISIKLSPFQIQYLQKARKLKLNESQKKKLKGLNIPPIVDILDPYYHDCTCAMIYGIWYKSNEVGFLDEKNDLEFENDPKLENLALDNYCIYIGLKGEIFYKGKQVTIDNLKKLLYGVLKNGYDNFYVYLPPSKGNPHLDKVYTARALIRKKITSLQLNWGAAYKDPVP